MITVAVIEDHPVFRSGLLQLLELHPELHVVAGTRTVEAALEAISAPPTVILLDLHLPGVAGADAVRVLTERGWPVLVLSAAGNREDVLDALSAGANGYLTKDAEPSEILAALRTVANGGTYVSPTLASYLLQALRDSSGESLGLSEREKQVLALLAQGETDADIAEALYISIHTVHTHLDRIREKTGRRRRPDLTRLAIEQGLLPPHDPQSTA